MISKKTPTDDFFLMEDVFKDYVEFHGNEVWLSDLVPKEIALFFYLIVPGDGRVIYRKSDKLCECGHKDACRFRFMIGRWIKNIFCSKLDFDVCHVVKQP